MGGIRGRNVRYQTLPAQIPVTLGSYLESYCQRSHGIIITGKLGALGDVKLSISNSQKRFQTVIETIQLEDAIILANNQLFSLSTEPVVFFLIMDDILDKIQRGSLRR